jgi:hypothetical protein
MTVLMAPLFGAKSTVMNCTWKVWLPAPRRCAQSDECVATGFADEQNR